MAFRQAIRFMSTSRPALHDSAVIGLFSNGQLAGLPRSASASAKSALEEELARIGLKGKAGEAKIVYGNFGLGSEIKKVALVGLGQNGATNAAKDRVRMAVAAGVKALKAEKATDIGISAMGGHDQAAAEGATLALYSFNQFKSGKKKTENGDNISVSLLEAGDDGESLLKAFEQGKITAKAQNLARTWMETPANHMTPTIFAERFQKEIEALGLGDKVEVIIHDQAWAESHNMGAFLSVARGSDEPLRFIEFRYKGAQDKNERPLALVGKGVTFDTGGISLKPSANMAAMKGDMGGAATVAAALWGIAALQLPINVVAGIPLTENMPSGCATKPGDVVTSMSGKTIEVDNTDAEGRLILADALTYISKTYQPHTLVDLATLTGAMDVALGTGYAGVFSTDDELWQQLENAGQAAHEWFWRMPLNSVYLSQITANTCADLINTGGRSAGSCTAAIFLREFVHGIVRDDGLQEREGEESTEVGQLLDPIDHPVRYAHIDIAGVMDTTKTNGYYAKGMTGRPARALIEFAKQLVNKQ
ncbi:bleomycin hydrolase [Actinomortierella wolfii]|nr:bleomycin hydrolase [Actinomortierella wolfii]